MTLIKTSILSFIATAIKILAGLVINKAVAVYIGPAGLALIGQFQNFTQLVMTTAQGAINTGVTKYTAEYGKKSEQIPVLFSTASKISLAASVTVGLGIILFANVASLQFLNSDEYSYVFIILGFTIVLFVLNSLLLSILNGLKEIKTWVTIRIIQSIYSLIFTTLLVVWQGLDGALIALVTNQSIVLVIVLWKLRNHPVIKISNFKGTFDKPLAKKLMNFSAMALASVIAVPISHLIVRNHIGINLSWEQAGYWQAIWYISKMYLMVATTTLTIYYLPKLSELTDKKEIKNELLHGYKVIMPVVISMAITIFLLRDYIIQLLFTDKFQPMRELFLWQLMGDVFQLASFLLAYYLVAKAKTIKYITIQFLFPLIFTILVYFLTPYFNLNGVALSYLITYFICFIYCLYVVMRDLHA